MKEEILIQVINPQQVRVIHHKGGELKRESIREFSEIITLLDELVVEAGVKKATRLPAKQSGDLVYLYQLKKGVSEEVAIQQVRVILTEEARRNHEPVYDGKTMVACMNERKDLAVTQINRGRFARLGKIAVAGTITAASLVGVQHLWSQEPQAINSGNTLSPEVETYERQKDQIRDVYYQLSDEAREKIDLGDFEVKFGHDILYDGASIDQLESEIYSMGRSR